jgi:hypothetical protein
LPPPTVKKRFFHVFAKWPRFTRCPAFQAIFGANDGGGNAGGGKIGEEPCNDDDLVSFRIIPCGALKAPECRSKIRPIFQRGDPRKIKQRCSRRCVAAGGRLGEGRSPGLLGAALLQRPGAPERIAARPKSVSSCASQLLKLVVRGVVSYRPFQ